MMRLRKLRGILLLLPVLLAIAGPALGAIDVYHFNTIQQQDRFHKLTEQLRCPKCQNQSIASSDADIARDMRQQVADMILKGRSDKDIVQYFVDRYGSFVTYKPPFDAHTAILWLGPGLLLLAGILVIVRLVRRASRQADDVDDAGSGDGGERDKSGGQR